jgi:uncharacterized membrane protein YhfC
MDTTVVATFAVVILLEILIPLGLGFWIVRRFGVSWKIFALGAAGFIGVQILHIPLVSLTQGPLYLFLIGFITDPTIILVILAVYLGLLAGLFEEIGRYLFYRYYFTKKEIALSREHGLLFGAGWGGVECIMVALLATTTLISYIVLSTTSGQIPGMPDDPATLAQINQMLALTPLDILPGLLERMMSITLQIAFSIMVLASVVYKKTGLLVLAVLWHALVDFCVVYLAGTQGVWVTELSLAVFAALALVYIFWEWKRLGARTTGDEEAAQGA